METKVASEEQSENTVSVPENVASVSGASRSIPFGTAGRSSTVGGASRSIPFSEAGRSSAVGGASRSSAVGGASRSIPFSEAGRSSAVGGASRSSAVGGASRSSAVGGSSPDGGIATDMEGYTQKTTGKSHSIPKKIKLPTQVGVDSEGAVRTDFPFDQSISRNKLRTLTHHTLFPVHPKKKNIEEWVAEQASTESLTTTTTTSSGDISNVSFVFGQTQYGSYSCVDIPETDKTHDMSNECENSSMIVNVSSRNTTDVDIVGDETQMDGGSDGTCDVGGDVTNNNNNISSESTLGSAELFSATSVTTVPETSLDASQGDADGSGDASTIRTVPESPITETQGDAHGNGDVTITEDLKGNDSTAQVDQAALLVGGDGEKHVTITVHSDVTGLVANISKKWKEYSKCLKNVSLTTSPVVSLPYFHSTAPPSKPAGTNVYKMTTSVTNNDTSGKKIKIYVDEDLDLESMMIQSRMRERNADPTKGPEIGNYFICIPLLVRLCKLVTIMCTLLWLFSEQVCHYRITC